MGEPEETVTMVPAFTLGWNGFSGEFTLLLTTRRLIAFKTGNAALWAALLTVPAMVGAMIWLNNHGTRVNLVFPGLLVALILWRVFVKLQGTSQYVGMAPEHLLNRHHRNFGIPLESIQDVVVKGKNIWVHYPSNLGRKPQRFVASSQQRAAQIALEITNACNADRLPAEDS